MENCVLDAFVMRLGGNANLIILVDVCEKVFSMVRSSTERFEARVKMLTFVARLIQVHELIMMQFYPFMHRYLQPNQSREQKLLCCAQN